MTKEKKRKWGTKEYVDKINAVLSGLLPRTFSYLSLLTHPYSTHYVACFSQEQVCDTRRRSPALALQLAQKLQQPVGGANRRSRATQAWMVLDGLSKVEFLIYILHVPSSISTNI